MLIDKDELWYRVLKARYGEKGGWLREGGRHSLAWWRSLCRVREGIGEGVGSWFESNTRRVVGDGKNTLFWHDIWTGEIPLKMKFPRLFELSVIKECSVEEMVRVMGSDGGWEGLWRRRLLAWEEKSVREYSVLLYNIVLQENISDDWRWLLDPSHVYSVRGAYRFLTNSGELVDRTLVDDIWHKQIPSKVSLMVWRLLRDRLPTKDNLVRMCVLHIDDVTCVSGCGHLETAPHLFVTCNIFSSLWCHVWFWLAIDFVPSGDLRQHFLQFAKMVGLPRSTHVYFRIIWFASVWVL